MGRIELYFKVKWNLIEVTLKLTLKWHWSDFEEVLENLAENQYLHNKNI